MKLFKEVLQKYLLFLAGFAVLVVLGFWLLEISLWQNFFNALAYCSISKSRLIVLLGSLSVITGLVYFFLKAQRSIILSIYIVTLTMIVYGLAHTIVFEGKVRSIYLYQYKFKHIKIGKLYYRKGWGWVDKVHYRDDHYEEIKHQLDHAEDDFVEIEIADGWWAPLGFRVDVYRKYKVDVQKAKEDQWAVITGIMMDFMELSEQIQEDSPWYHGNQLSAWQFDDMSSNLLACLDKSGREQGESIKEVAELNKLWGQEGLETVQKKIKLQDVWSFIKKNELTVQSRVDEAKPAWEVID